MDINFDFVVNVPKENSNQMIVRTEEKTSMAMLNVIHLAVHVCVCLCVSVRMY